MTSAPSEDSPESAISPKEKRSICQAARKIFYADRTERVLMRELERTLGPQRLHNLLAYTSGVFPNIKYLDAKRALEAQRSICSFFEHSQKTPRKGEVQWKPQNPVLTITA